jgi:hypothetical protein
MTRRVLFLVRVLLIVAFCGLRAANAHAEPPAPTASAAAAPAAVPANIPNSELDNELPPDVRARLTPEQLHQVMMERAKRPPRPEEPPAVAIIVPVAFFLVVFATFAAAFYAGYRKERQRHETIRVALERGVSVPAALYVPERAPRSDLRRGVLLLCAGIGLLATLVATSSERGAWAASLIPILLGAGYLIVHVLERRSSAAGAPQGELRSS